MYIVPQDNKGKKSSLFSSWFLLLGLLAITMGGSEEIYQDKCDSKSMNGFSFEDSANSTMASSSSSDIMEDTTSSSSSSSSSSDGPLYELSELMAQLPIKRGLSKYYQGKSQTFASLSSVKSLEDLAKKGRPNRRKAKASKSYGGGLDSKIYCPKATISKKSNTSRVSLLSSLGRRGKVFGSFRHSSHVQKNL